MSATTTVEVRGHKVMTRSPRRYLVVAVRPKTIVLREGDESCVLFGRKPGTYVAFA